MCITGGNKFIINKLHVRARSIEVKILSSHFLFSIDSSNTIEVNFLPRSIVPSNIRLLVITLIYFLSPNLHPIQICTFYERIIDYLARNGWSKRLKAKGLKEHGVDIKVKNDKVARYFLVECKGDASPKSKYPRSHREERVLIWSQKRI